MAQEIKLLKNSETRIINKDCSKPKFVNFILLISYSTKKLHLITPITVEDLKNTTNNLPKV